MSLSWPRVSRVKTAYLGPAGDVGPGIAAIIKPQDEELPAWQPAVTALQARLESQRGGGRIRVVVSNAYVRYLLMPWTEQRLAPNERTELARNLFADRYGEYGEWRIALEAERFQAPTLAAAMESSLLVALQALCDGLKLKMVAVIPALVESLRQQRAALAGVDDGWFVDGSDGRLASLAFCNGCWVQVSNEPGSDLLAVLRRDAIRAPDLMSGKVLAIRCNGNLESIASTWSLVRLDSRSRELVA